jgi:hypothetical protein
MPAGDEPQLSSQSDNTPMISGRGTAVIVTARGAYTAGNLDKLIEHLDERQQFEMQRIVARHTAEYVAGVRPSLREIYCDAVIRWADEPNKATREAVWALVTPDDIVGDHIRGHLPGCVLSTVLRPASEMCRHASGALTLTTEYRNSSVSWATMDIGLKRWHLDVAWALLMNRLIPTDAPRNPQWFRDLEQNAELMYQARNMDALTELMSTEQQVGFKHAVIRQGLGYLQQNVPTIELEDWEQHIVRTMQQWADQPESFDEQLWERFFHQVLQRYSNFCLDYTPVEHMLFAFEAFTVAKSAARSAHGIAHVVNTITMLNIRRENPQCDWYDDETMEMVTDWQTEAAWAILHDRDVPPLTIG